MARAARARWTVLRSALTILRREFLGLLRSEKGFWIAVLAGLALAALEFALALLVFEKTWMRER